MGDDVRSKAILGDLLIVWLNIGETKDAGKNALAASTLPSPHSPFPLYSGSEQALFSFFRVRYLTGAGQP